MAAEGKISKGKRRIRPTIPPEVREEVLGRLEPEQERYLQSGDAVSFDFEFRGGYLYLAARQRRGLFGGSTSVCPLGRLGYTGDPGKWDFEIWLYSKESYDTAHEFPFGEGTPEQCFAVAADFYLWEYDALSAGCSVGTRPTARPADQPFGLAWLLPPCTGDVTPSRPDIPASVLAIADCDVVTNFTSFVRFVEGRSFDLAPRAFGFRRPELGEINQRLRHPHPIGERPVQDMLPQVQICFSVAKALGLLEVSRTQHRATGSGRIGEFLARPVTQRWWDIIEALWQRIPWSSLRAGARGASDMQQAARWWLGLELSRRAEPILFDWHVSFDSEILECFLFPFWRDAGLVTLEHDETMRAAARHMKTDRRWTCLRRVEVTDAGRWAFAKLAAASPRDPEVTNDLPSPDDGRWDGRGMIQRLAWAAPLAGPLTEEQMDEVTPDDE